MSGRGIKDLRGNTVARNAQVIVQGEQGPIMVSASEYGDMKDELSARAAKSQLEKADDNIPS